MEIADQDITKKREKRLTQLGLLFLISAVQLLVILLVLGLFIYDFFISKYPTSFFYTFPMISVAFISLFYIIMIIGLKPKSYRDSKPLVHRVFVGLSLLFFLCGIVWVSSGMGRQDFAILGLVQGFFIFLMQAHNYSIVNTEDRMSKERSNYFSIVEQKERRFFRRKK